MINLAVDIGNSRTKLAVFESDKLIFEQFCEELTKEFLREIFKKFDIKNSIISSVTHNKREFISFLKSRTDFVELTNETPVNLEINYLTPKTLGMDRIAAAIGALEILPEKNLLVVDTGSCVTMDLITADRVFHGGNIAPGFLMRINAMHDYTAKLPTVMPQIPENILGRYTADAVLCGAFWGIVSEINSLYVRLKEDYPQLAIIITGGDAHYFEKHIINVEKLVPDLVLQGLNSILTNFDK
ncbi:MAG: type III pantothenate kinase [Prevotellaceae bacterium]|jgi:type III pantothenate kinase|nr:type III pantothenate kinase [Prevotellaceae bacterium]